MFNHNNEFARVPYFGLSMASLLITPWQILYIFDIYPLPTVVKGFCSYLFAYGTKKRRITFIHLLIPLMDVKYDLLGCILFAAHAK